MLVSSANHPHPIKKGMPWLDVAITLCDVLETSEHIFIVVDYYPMNPTSILGV